MTYGISTLLLLAGLALTFGTVQASTSVLQPRQAMLSESIPNCVSECANAVFSNGAGGNCSPTNYICLCNLPQYTQQTTACFARCSPDDQKKGIEFASKTCAAAGVKLNLGNGTSLSASANAANDAPPQLVPHQLLALGFLIIASIV
ncbi:hypothetical protein O181_004602 [Austropuccinia psidii MF-1]|uniref:CFEM domain-containing protein n=1 Tax=Austropuccinia psidii MF-1 TaxID=1389203 RepID=A0A9Q3BGK0_9BASI|nr:hypothetical protein [Austropuccinia psidii MF-1]